MLCFIHSKVLLSADLFVQNWSVLHIVIDEVGWTHYLGLDADPIQRKHEGVELLDRREQGTMKQKDRVTIVVSKRGRQTDAVVSSLSCRVAVHI